jgi:putative phosphoesterase
VEYRGVLFVRVALIADVHGNVVALKRVLGEIEGCRIYCVGDLVGYGPWPNEVIDLLREKAAVCVIGNHDYAAVTGDVRNLSSVAETAALWTKDKLTRDSARFLGSLPMMLSTNDFFMVHGSPRYPLDEYVSPQDSYAEYLLNEEKEGVVVLAHTHIPFIRQTEKRIVLNPGSVGQPRDGNPKASYAVYDTEKKEAVIHRVEYPIDEVAEKIMKEGLPPRLGERLYKGE